MDGGANRELERLKRRISASIPIRFRLASKPNGANVPYPTREEQMAKGQIKGNKEAKKPKGEKPKGEASAYKRSQGKGGQPISVPGKK